MRKNSQTKLSAICLLDGRNWEKVEVISLYFSEFALIKYRLWVEIAYFLFLAKETKIMRRLTSAEQRFLTSLWQKFNFSEAEKIKKIEKKINHDVKAVEYYLREKLKGTSLSSLTPFLHFGLTSYDINIPAYALMLSDFRQKVLGPKIREILASLKKLIKKTKGMAMLARTHGQPALPTTLGKELAVFYQRVKKSLAEIENFPFEAKLTGAVGNFNALSFVYPEYDWIALSQKFISSLGLSPNVVTTQILPYDFWLSFFDACKRLNNVLLNLVQDLWWYISFDYFRQKKKKGEVGSSTMSHKVNPIAFENAEGNLGLANALFEFFVRKLAVSRLQRDLSDSTVKRDFGLAFGFSLLAWESLLAGLKKISPYPQKMKEDLENHWEIFAEGLQSYLRAKGEKEAYELLQKKTQGKVLSQKALYRLIEDLPLNPFEKEKLKVKNLTEYLGLAEKIADLAIKE